MIRYILDTDHVTLLEDSNAVCLQRLNDVGYDLVAVTAVTVEERLQGWMNAIRRGSAPNHGDRLIWGYAGLRSTVQYLAGFQLVDWTVAAGERFQGMRRQGVRIGTQDLRIAAIALSLDATVVTRNLRDFGQVPGLTIEDWMM
jgi:tRNA(fMet)-specific endonuclease VapC